MQGAVGDVMRVLVTGGTGFIGRRLAAELEARGDDVVALSRDPELAARQAAEAGHATRTTPAPPGAARDATTAGAGARRTPASGGISWVEWNPATGPPSVARIGPVDAVVNLLGEPIAAGRWTRSRRAAIRDSRVLGTRNLAKAIFALSPRPRVFVSGSAIGYYGPRGDEELDEGAAPGEGYLASLAREWESEALRDATPDVRVVLLRTGIVLGPEGGALREMLRPFRLGLGGRVGSGRQWMSWIHLEDICGLILHAIDAEAVRGPLNGTAPLPVRNSEFARTLGRVLHRPAVLPAPAFALRLALGEMAEALLLTGQRVVPRRALETGYAFRHPRLEGALESLLRPRAA